VAYLGSINTGIHTPWSLLASLLASGYNSAIVQYFFSYRLKVLFNRWEPTLFCWLLISFRLTISMAQAVIGSDVTTFKFVTAHKTLLVITLAVNPVQDLFTAVPLFLRILKMESRSRTKLTWKKLFFILAESGFLQFFIGLAALITFTIQNKSFIWFGIRVVGSQVYANSLLLSLNGRRDWFSPYTKKPSSLGFINGNLTSDRLQPKVDGIRIEMSNVTSDAPESTHDQGSFASNMHEDLPYVFDFSKTDKNGVHFALPK